MRDLAPNITRQRLLIEAQYNRTVKQVDVEDFLRELPAELDLRIYSEPVVYSPGGEGKEDNQGYDGFVALIDSGISIYVWENAKFLSVVIYTRYQGAESKIELKIEQGQVVDLIVKDVKGKRSLPGKQLNDFKELTEKMADEIVQSWIDYFILHKKVVAKKITGKI